MSRVVISSVVRLQYDYCHQLAAQTLHGVDLCSGHLVMKLLEAESTMSGAKLVLTSRALEENYGGGKVDDRNPSIYPFIHTHYFIIFFFLFLPSLYLFRCIWKIRRRRGNTEAAEMTSNNDEAPPLLLFAQLQKYILSALCNDGKESIMIGCSGTNCTELEQAETYNLGMSHISSKSFLCDLSKALRKSFHSCFSCAITIRNEGTVLPIFDIYDEL